MSKVPLGVILLAVLDLVIGFLLLIGSSAFPFAYSWLVVGGVLSSIPYGQPIIALIYILLGIGLLTLNGGVWRLNVIFAIINLIILLLGFPSIALVPFIINLIILLYLNQGSIKRRFGV